MCEYTEPSQATLDMDDRSPAQARVFLRAATCRPHHAAVLDEATLLVSELVTNAVKHGTPPITVCVECNGTEGMQVRVSDGSNSDPVPTMAAETDESGRGMALVDIISDAWGVTPTETGKQVWFRIAA